MNAQEDERMGLPSGSSALEDQLCCGRFLAQKNWDELGGANEPEEEAHGSVPDMDRDAEAGKRIHLLYAGKDCPEASGKERARAEDARSVDARIKADWLGTYEDELPVTELREHRWWVKDTEGRPVYSGQTDVVWIRGREQEPADVLLGDLKGLWGYHDPAKLNVQIRRYIAIISLVLPEMGYTKLRAVWAYLNQPAKTLSPGVVLFSDTEIEVAQLELWTDLAAMMDENAPRTPGPVQCTRCRAKLLCEEFIAWQEKNVLPMRQDNCIPPKLMMEQNVAGLPCNRLVKLLPWAKALRQLADLAEAEAKRRLKENPEALFGEWVLKPNAKRSKIVKVSEVWNRLNAAYEVSADEFLGHCGLSKESCEEMVRTRSGLKGKALDERLRKILDGTTSLIPVQDSLVEKGKE